MGNESTFVTCSCRLSVSESGEPLAVNRIPVPAEIPPLMSDTVLNAVPFPGMWTLITPTSGCINLAVSLPPLPGPSRRQSSCLAALVVLLESTVILLCYASSLALLQV